MYPKTQLSIFIQRWQDSFQVKRWFFETYFSISLFFFFLGFICGNLFGTFLPFFRQWVQWDGLIILLTILIIEFINYLHFYVYKPRSVPLVSSQKRTYTVQMKNIRFVNFYKIGLLLGFFIDAFKVGS